MDMNDLVKASRMIPGIRFDPYRQGDVELCVVMAFMRRRRG
jgi:hypothetical protein